MTQHTIAEVDYPVETAEAARILGRAPATIIRWRSIGVGPAYIKASQGHSGRVSYLIADLLNWRDGHRIDPAADDEAA